MHGLNSNYGHKAILASVVGISEEPPIWGVLQHGWTPYDGWDRGHPLPAFWPRLVWSRTAISRVPSDRSTASYRAVGSPFSYLINMNGDGFQPRFDSKVIAFPIHSSETVQLHWAHADYASELLEREDGPVTVCLYWLEFQDPEIRSSYQSRGHHVVTVGSGRNDRFFLPRWLRLLDGHHRAVSNIVSTAVIYAASLGLDTEIYGPKSNSPDSDTHDAALASAQALSLLKISLGRTQDKIRIPMDWARSELGWDDRLDPNELAEVLGWLHPKLALGGILMGANYCFRQWKWRDSVTSRAHN